MNFLALLGWSYDDKTTIMSRDELTERFSLERVQPSPATFDYKKLEWMNGVYIRATIAGRFADRLVSYLREQGYDWDEELHPPLGAARAGEDLDARRLSPSSPASFSTRSSPIRLCSTGKSFARAADVLEEVEPFTADRIEQALRGLAEELELSPRKAFQPIRVAVTGSKISPGLFESLELLGKERSLARIRSR